MKFVKSARAFSIVALIPLSLCGAAEAAQPDAVDFYKDRYGLTDVFQKRVDNRGNGFEDLYGTRNFRSVLSGILYRGGANNRYHRFNRRNNQNPLPDDGLQSLCEEGFGQAIYLYSNNFQSAPQSVTCVGPDGRSNELVYKSIVPFKGDEKTISILRIIHDALIDSKRRPMYVHCWNGWHASGYIAALALRQFCGWSADNAVDYWRRNTDGHDRRHASVMRMIRNFQADPDLEVPLSLREKICPSEAVD